MGVGVGGTIVVCLVVAVFISIFGCNGWFWIWSLIFGVSTSVGVGMIAC